MLYVQIILFFKRFIVLNNNEINKEESTYTNPIEETLLFQSMRGSLGSGKQLFYTGIVDSLKPLLALPFAKNWTLYLCKSEERAKEVLQDCKAFSENVYFYPPKDYLFYKADTRGHYILRERGECLRHLLEDSGGMIVTTFPALMEKMEGKNAFRGSLFTVKVGMSIELSDLQDKLSEMGYKRAEQVEMRGEYSIRGGIVDLFSNQMEDPVRIEFFGEEVDSIRSFSLESQRSLEQISEAKLYPAGERGFSSSLKAFSLLDYFPKETAIFLDEPQRLLEEAERVEEEFLNFFAAGSGTAAKSILGVSTDSKGFPDTALKREPEVKRQAGEDEEERIDLFSPETLLTEIGGRVFAAFSTLGTGLDSLGSAIDSGRLIEKSFTTKEIPAYGKHPGLFQEDIKRLFKEKYRVLLYSPSALRASRLAEKLREEGISAYCPDAFSIPKEGEKSIQVCTGFLRHGFSMEEEKLFILTEAELFGQSLSLKKKKKKKKAEGVRIGSLTEIEKGDYVVHESHGIGIYQGIERITTDGVSKDFIKILYGDGGNLYLPVTKLDGIEKYAGKEAKIPKLNRLNGTEWQKTKARVKGAVKEIAKELLRLYAKRQNEEGYAFSEDTVWQKEFEEAFPYEETGDQILAIEATKEDMESKKIMDRLVCGDVGYGKTEIALRAAFKAVQDSKQVAYLCPTTILAQQIYNNFVERMKGFPVGIRLLSRFQSGKELKKSLEELSHGRADIAIGTHRLLSKDVHFKNLGLLVVDEEQRFGVSDKERIKSLKENVDVLTLSATPIPRTLHMSLVGIRDLSVLEEPPLDRLPIQTYVMEENEASVREAIERELRRNGQVYYVHNRVKSIADTAMRVQRLVPYARVAYAHGQMGERELEKIMLSFIAGEIDVLVSTTIIETGLDIPNANTLIIQDADRMGLSQLYQIRGRVGRSNRISYAFLLYKKGKSLTEESEKRLKAIREFTELGSGIRIALRDLEIRGAGNVLGAEQHGHMEAVGYELYTKLLRHAVLLEKGEKTEEESIECQMDVDFDAYIPESYIPNEEQKLEVYQKISTIGSEEEELDLKDELIDRYGDLPDKVENLFLVAMLKLSLSKIGVLECKIKRGEILMQFSPKAKLDTAKIPVLVQESQGEVRFQNGEQPALFYKKKNSRVQEKIEETMNKAGEIAALLSLN